MSALFAWLEAMDVLGWEQFLMIALPALFVTILVILWVVLLIRHIQMRKKEEREDDL